MKLEKYLVLGLKIPILARVPMWWELGGGSFECEGVREEEVTAPREGSGGRDEWRGDMAWWIGEEVIGAMG